MANKTDKEIVLLGAGDIGPERADPGSIFRHVKDTISRSDVAFVQLEVNLSRRPSAGELAHENARDPRIAAAMKETGFNVVSFASNHVLDSGLNAFLDTIDNLKEQKLGVIGVGHNIAEARTPAIIERKGTHLAFLGYNSILKPGYWAEGERPGCAPLRGWTFYEPMDPHQPGLPPRIHTFPYRDDLAAMEEDIWKAKAQADLVIVSMHCGLHFMPAAIAEYQRDLAHAAIDAGAGLILQHHAHILKGIEVYKGKAIFYSLSNFALEVSFMTPEFVTSPQFLEERRALNPAWKPPYPEYPKFPFPTDSRKTLIAKCIISGKEIKRVSFLPVIINRQAEPEILSSTDKRFGEMVVYMTDITRDQGLDTRFTIEGDEVVIE